MAIKENEFSKMTYEEFTITVDFSANLAVGETVVSQNVGATDKTGTDASEIVTDQLSVMNNSAGLVSVLVRAGELLMSPYKIIVQCVTSGGHKWELDLAMKIVK